MNVRHLATPPRRIAAVASLALVVGAVSGASSVLGATPTTGTALDLGTPVAGGTLVYDMQQEPNCHNAHVGPQYAAQTLTRLLTDSLISQDPDGTGFSPWLATSWEASPDARSYTFTLREDVTFTNGERLDAVAVKENFDSIADPASKNLGGQSFLGQSYDSTEVLGDYQVRINFKTGNAAFLQAASTPYLGIQAPGTLPRDGSCTGAVGSGPFIFDSYTPQGSFVVHRNPDYHTPPAYAANTGPAYLDGIVFQFVPETATRTGSLTSGQVDAIDGASARDLTDLIGQGFSLVRSDQPGQPWMGHFNNVSGVTADPEVRRAFREAIDFDGIIQAVWGGEYHRAYGPITQFTAAYDPAVETAWTYDPASANARLDAAGWTERDGEGFRTKDGQRLTIVWISDPNDIREQRPEFIQAAKELVKEAGIDLDWQSIDSATATQRRTDFDFGIYAHSYVRNEPAYLDTQFLNGRGINGYNDPEVNAWLDEGRATTDPAARAAAYAKVQEKVTGLAVTLPIYAQSQFVFFSPKVHGIVTDATGWIQFYDAWKDPS